MCNGWFKRGKVWIEQSINYNKINSQYIPKGIQKVLKERNLWSSGGLNLEHLKSKYFNSQVVVECKICIKGHKYELYIISRQYSRMVTYTKNWRHDTCAHKKENCQCMGKKYCITCEIKKEKCVNSKELLPKCTTNSNFFLDYKLLYTNCLIKLLCMPFIISSAWFCISKIWN